MFLLLCSTVFLGNLVPKIPLHEVDLKGDFLLYPLSMIKGSGCYYVFDGLSNNVLCFDKDRLIYAIDRKGNGPGEFNKIAAIYYGNGSLYVCGKENNKISIFRDNGNHVKDIRINKDIRKMVQVSDMLVLDSFIYLVYQNGTDWLNKFDLQGNLVFSYPKTIPDFQVGCGNAFRFFMKHKTTELNLFSRFTGEWIQVSLLTAKVSKKGSVQDPISNSILEKFLTQGIQDEYQLSNSILFSKPIEINKTFLAPFSNKQQKLFLGIESQQRHFLDATKIPFRVKDMHQFDDLFFLINDDGELFWTKMDFKSSAP